MRWSFGSFAPDVPALEVGRDGCLRSTNVIPVRVGYVPFPSWNATAMAALAARPRGSETGTSLGNAYHYVGTGTKLYERSGAAWTDRTRAAGGNYALTDTDRWKMLRYNDDVYGLPGHAEPVQYIAIGAGNFADLAAAPRARFGAIVSFHMMVGNLKEGSTVRPYTVRWPAIDNPQSWPTPGTDAALAAQSGERDLPSKYGQIMGIVGGDVGAIFQEKAITVAEYIGGDVMYSFSRRNVPGLFIPDGAIPLGNAILYPSEDGWNLFDGATHEPIGADLINNYFLRDLDPEHLDKCGWEKDPDRAGIFYFLYPGAGNVDGRPNRILVFNSRTRQFSIIEGFDGWLLSRWIEGTPGLDEPPDEPLDEPGLPSLDSTAEALLVEELAGYDANLVLGRFNGAPMAATFESGDIEPFPGALALVVESRPLIDRDVDAPQLTVEVASFDVPDAALVFVESAGLNRKGWFDHHADNRYHRVRVRVTGGRWKTAYGCDVRFAATGDS